MTPIILLFVAGVALIFAEFFVPGGALGVLGGLLVIGSIVLGWYRYPEYGVFFLAGELTGVILVIIIGLWVMFKTPLGGALILKTKQENAAGYSSYAQDPALVGQLAIVHTTLRPAGSIMIGSRRIDAVSNGTFIDAGKTVRIIQVEGHRVVCEEAPEITATRQPA